jgi:hypothetical protein
VLSTTNVARETPEQIKHCCVTRARPHEPFSESGEKPCGVAFHPHLLNEIGQYTALGQLIDFHLAKNSCRELRNHACDEPADSQYQREPNDLGMAVNITARLAASEVISAWPQSVTVVSMGHLST